MLVRHQAGWRAGDLCVQLQVVGKLLDAVGRRIGGVWGAKLRVSFVGMAGLRRGMGGNGSGRQFRLAGQGK